MAKKCKLLWGSASVVLATALSSGLAVAQDQSSSPSAEDNEIVVTAQRRSEQAADVPVAITVLSAERLEESNVFDSLDLPRVVPGLSFTHDGGSPVIYMRGIGTDITSPGVEPSVATYVDGAYMPSTETAFIDFFDVSQVEVLRGPQGTLFGRNATGGAINITTRGPTNDFIASLEGSVGNYGLRRVGAFIGGPLSPGARGSLSVVSHQRDGNYDELLTGAERNAQDYYSVNARLQFDLGSQGELEFYGRYLEEDDDFGTVFTELSGNSVGAAFGATVATEPFTTATDMDNRNYKEVTSLGVRAEWDFGGFTLSSRSNFTDYIRDRTIDFDMSTARLVNLASIYDGDFISQEFLLTGQQGEALDWVAGAFYMTGQDGFWPPIQVGTTFDTNADLVPDLPGTQFIGSISEVDTYAAFADVTYHLTNEWSLAAGIRYSHEEKTLTNRVVFGEDLFGAPVGPSLAFPDVSDDWSSVTWRVLASYDNGPLLVFGKVETGFIAGAFNTANPISPGPVDPEEVTAYELGFKWRSADRTVSLEGSAYYNDYTNLHIQVVDALTGVSILDQAEAAESFGADMQLRVRPTERLDVAFGVSYQNSEYVDYSSGGVLLPNPPFPGFAPASVVLGGSLDMSGNSRPRSPEWTTNLSATYTIPFASGDLIFSGDAFMSSEFFFDPANIVSQPSYSLFNARIAYNDRSGYSIALWGRNLSDETYLNAALVGSTGIGGIHADQMTYGVTLGVDF